MPVQTVTPLSASCNPRGAPTLASATLDRLTRVWPEPDAATFTIETTRPGGRREVRHGLSGEAVLAALGGAS